MCRHAQRRFCLCFIAVATSLAICGLANAQESFDIAARQLRSQLDYRTDSGIFAVSLSSRHTRLGPEDVITVDVAVECLSGCTLGPLTNPFLEPDLPECLVVSVFDSQGRFVGSVPEFDDSRTDREKRERLAKTSQSNFQWNESLGTSVCLSTGPASAACTNRRTLFLEMPGTYLVQAVCAKQMFEMPPLIDPGNDKRLAWSIEQRRKDSVSEACRSATLTAVVGDRAEENPTSKPIAADSTAPTLCQLELVDSTKDAEAVVTLRHTNVSPIDLYLHEPVMRHIGDLTSPVRLWLKDSQGAVLQDLSYSLAEGQYGGPHPIVRLPAGGFVSRKHKVPNKWNNLDRTLEAVYSPDLFMTKAYTDFEVSGKQPPPGISAEDYYESLLKGRPQFLIKSNVLELPATTIDGKR